MQIAETLNDGLRREFAVTIPTSEVNARIDRQLAEVAGRIRMPGFRPGKVPMNLVRKMHGAALRKEAVEEAVKEGIQRVVSENNLRPAMQPQVDLERGAEAEEDVAFKVALEVLPSVEPGDVEGLSLERLVVEPGDADLDAALTRLAEGQKRFDPAAPSYKAKKGDTVVIDFEGSIGGEPFDRGKGEGVAVELGSGQLIPGFEDGLVGAKANEQKTLKVTFPDNYGVPYLAGREAEFEVTVNEVRKPVTPKVDDEFAKGLGLDSLDALKEILRDQVESELSGLMRTYMKRRVLDALAAAHDFPVPQSMVDAEFGAIWKQLQAEAAREPDPQAALKSLEDERDSYRRIAERRVRLGLLLSEIGRRQGIEVTQAEMNRLMAQEVARYPQAQREQVVKFIRENPMAAAQLRAPLYEDKVVDYVIEKANVTERPATREEVQAALESEEGALEGASLPVVDVEAEPAHVHGPDCDHDHDHGH